MTKIKIITQREGIGEYGSVIDVSDERAARWVAKGFAELVDAPMAKTAPKAPAKVGPANGTNAK